MLPTLGEALENENHQLRWTRCADLPAPMYGASVAVSNKSVYVTPGSAPDNDVYSNVFCYDISNDQWTKLPSPEHTVGILCMVDGRLNFFGGNTMDNVVTNRVSTYDPDINKWIRYYPNMLKSRSKPGVVAYLEHIIVAGGAKDKFNFNDDIEILNWHQLPFQWQQVDISLPVPMWTVSLTVSSDKLLIVGYTQAKGRSASTYQLPVELLFEEPLYANQMQNHTWVKLCSAPYHDAALVPCSNPPVIVGGNSRGLPVSDISVYSPSDNRWRNCASLCGPRINVAVATIYSDTIIVLGGHTSAESVQAAIASSLFTVEMGKVEVTV